MKTLPLPIRPVLLASAALFATSSIAAPKAPAKVAEDSVIAMPDVVVDKAPVVESMAQLPLPDWTLANASALHGAITAAAAEGLIPADYAPGKLETAIAAGPGAALNQVATDTFLLYATHLRDGRTPNAARRQWFMVDPDADKLPLLPMLADALARGDVAGVLSGLNPTHPEFAPLRAALAKAKDKPSADRIRVNIERWRWMPRDFGDRYILTNVPEYMTRIVHTGKIIGTHKAVVGKAATATPQLSVMATGIIINPTWRLPRSIINEGIGATIANNPASARAQGYSWTGKGPTLAVTQAAGPGNALGMMKLEMLNDHAIYLHDTPSKGAFSATDRAFSHGCIRTERALHFSGLMAVMFAGQSPEDFGAAYASGKTTRFGFEQSFPVYIAYWTAAAGADGKVTQFKDIYGRDAPVIASFARPGRAAGVVLAAAPAAVPSVAPVTAPTGR